MHMSGHTTFKSHEKIYILGKDRFKNCLTLSLLLALSFVSLLWYAKKKHSFSLHFNKQLLCYIQDDSGLALEKIKLMDEINVSEWEVISKIGFW